MTGPAVAACALFAAWEELVLAKLILRSCGLAALRTHPGAVVLRLGQAKAALDDATAAAERYIAITKAAQ